MQSQPPITVPQALQSQFSSIPSLDDLSDEALFKIIDYKRVIEQRYALLVSVEPTFARVLGLNSLVLTYSQCIGNKGEITEIQMAQAAVYNHLALDAYAKQRKTLV